RSEMLDDALSEHSPYHRRHNDDHRARDYDQPEVQIIAYFLIGGIHFKWQLLNAYSVGHLRNELSDEQTIALRFHNRAVRHLHHIHRKLQVLHAVYFKAREIVHRAVDAYAIRCFRGEVRFALVLKWRERVCGIGKQDRAVARVPRGKVKRSLLTDLDTVRQ